METRTLTKKDLHNFIFSKEFYQITNIPISKHRAISQINNPRASDDDIVLVIQFDENKVVGYLGVLPDHFYDGKEFQKAGWLSCFWVDENYKSKNVAANLFRRVIKAWQQKILITNMVPWLEPIYQKTGIFQTTQYKIGLRGYMRFNLADILPPKYEIFKKLTFILRISDRVLNALGDIRFLFYRAYKNTEIKYEHLNHLDKTIEDFINSHNKKNWNLRGKREIEWIMKYPWILEGVKNDFNTSRYYFSSFSKRFFYQLIKYSDHKENIVGLMLVCVRDNNLTVPYIYTDYKYLEIISKSLINIMVYLKINMITIFNEDLSQSIKNLKAPFLFKKEVKRPYLISKNLNYITELNFQDGDGDCAFY